MWFLWFVIFLRARFAPLRGKRRRHYIPQEVPGYVRRLPPAFSNAQSSDEKDRVLSCSSNRFFRSSPQR